jgi:hypothetical protein
MIYTKNVYPGGGAGTQQSLHELTALRIGRTDMTGPSARKTANQRKPKARKFYIISYSLAHKLADFEVENLEVLSPDGGALRPPEGRQGFPVYPEKPRVVIGKRKSGPPPSDIELYHPYWLISDRLGTPYSLGDVFCNQTMNDACKEAGIKGIKFYNCFRR